MNKRLKWGVLVILAAALLGWGIRYLMSNRNTDVAGDDLPRQQNTRRALNVNALVIKEQTLTDQIRLTGRLIPDEEVNLSFETSGKVVKIYFTEGTAVKKGQLLAKVNDAPLQAQLNKLEAQLQLAQDRVYRQNTLLEKDAVSKEAYEQVKTDLESLNADIELVKANIEQSELRAPFDGIIGLRQISEGAFASPTTVVAKLTKISPLKIELSVPERYANQIKKGTNLDFEIDGNLKVFTASVYATESKIDPLTNTLPVRALYPNTRGEVLPGRSASISIRLQEIDDAIAIPSEALVPEMGLDKVFLYKSGKAEPVVVTKGLRTESQVQILEGLHLGDTIIISGTLQLRTGLDVVPDNIY